MNEPETADTASTPRAQDVRETFTAEDFCSALYRRERGGVAMTKTPEDIAREIAQLIWGGALIDEAEKSISAALRSYADEKLEEAAARADRAAEFCDAIRPRSTEWEVRAQEARNRATDIRSLKSSDSPVTR